MSHFRVGRREFIGTMAAQIAAAAPDTNKDSSRLVTKMKLAIGSDHAGFPLKGPLVKVLESWGHPVKDCGTFSADPVDFPDITQKVCDEVLSGRAERAILVCGSGVGASIAANKIRNIRAALCHDTFCAHQGVEHDNVNVLCMGAWIVGPKVAEEILQSFLNARFTSSDPDFRRRVEKLEHLNR